MKICFPIDQDKGLASRIHGRFGSAGTFMLVDSETRRIEDVRSHDPLSGPVWQFDGWQVDAVVVGNIGARTLAELSRSGLRAFQACKPTVAENLEFMAQSELRELTSPQLPEAFGAGFGMGRGLGQGTGRGAGRGAGRRAGRGAGRSARRGLGPAAGAGRDCRFQP